MSAWSEYKKKLGDTRPWDILNPNTPHATQEEAKERFNICASCPELIKATAQCKQCGCFMKVKVKLKEASCPLLKW
jgi:hypothetical protein